ncbi:MAG: DUF6460 domain-containing protein [Xanthobacteraceae bacterium]
MLHPFLRTLVKIILASLVAGVILNQLGVTPDELMRQFGLSREKIEELARQGLAWALPNLMLGAMVIVPVWFLVYLFRPPGRSSE